MSQQNHWSVPAPCHCESTYQLLCVCMHEQHLQRLTCALLCCRSMTSVHGEFLRNKWTHKELCICVEVTIVSHLHATFIKEFSILGQLAIDLFVVIRFLNKCITYRHFWNGWGSIACSPLQYFHRPRQRCGNCLRTMGRCSTTYPHGVLLSYWLPNSRSNVSDVALLPMTYDYMEGDLSCALHV